MWDCRRYIAGLFRWGHKQRNLDTVNPIPIKAKNVREFQVIFLPAVTFIMDTAANELVTISCAHLHLYFMAVQVWPKQMQYFLYVSSDL